MTALAPGQAAPDFALRNSSGGLVRLSEYQKSRPALLVFFKHDCPTCQLGMPFVDRIYRRHRGDAVAFLAVAEDRKEDAAAFAKERAVMMPFVLEDAPYATSEAFGLSHVPTLLLLDADRKVLDVHVGFSKRGFQALADRVAALAGKPSEPLFPSMVPLPETKPG